MEDKSTSYGMFLAEKSTILINFSNRLKKSVQDFFCSFTDSLSDGICLCRIIQNYGSTIIKLSKGNHLNQDWSMQFGEFMSECSVEIEKSCETMLQECNLDITELLVFFDNFVHSRLILLKNDANKLESLEVLYNKKNYKYEKRSNEIQTYVKYYNESENNANSIYNLSQMNKNYEKIENGIKILINFENELESLIGTIKELRIMTGNTYLDLSETYDSFYAEFLEKSKHLTINYTKKVMILFEKIQDLFNSKLTKVLLVEIYPCYPKLEENEKSRNTKWPFYLDDPESIPDSFLSKYSDLTQAYVEKVLAMVEERILVLKKLKCHFTETSNYLEKLSNGLEKKQNFLKIPCMEILGKKLMTFSLLCNTIALEAQALSQELERMSKISWVEISKILKQYYKLCKEVFNKKNDPNNIPVKYRNKLKAIIRDLSHVTKEVLYSFIIDECKKSTIFKNKIETLVFQTESDIKDLYKVFEHSVNEYDIPEIAHIIPDEIKAAFSKGFQEIISIEKEKEIVIEKFFDTKKISLKKFEHLKHPDLYDDDQSEINAGDVSELNNKEFSFGESNMGSISKKSSMEFSPNKRRKVKGASKVVLEGDETLLETFSCALQDKLVLHGKLQITNKKLYFHSYFNRENLFFGDTRMAIPKGDIVKIEKKHNAILFDNSIQIITTRGKVFLTSFMYRDRAYNCIIKNLKPPEQPELLEADEQDDDDDEAGLTTYEEIEKLRNSNITIEPLETFRNDSFLKYLLKTPCSLEEIYDVILSGKPVELESKQYGSFWEYVRTGKTGDTEFKETQWDKTIEYRGIAAEMPEIISREMNYIHPVKKQIPFMPKVCPVIEKHKLIFPSEKEIVNEIEFKTSKVPYSDSFYMIFRYNFLQVGPQRVEVRYILKHIWIKSTIMQSTIEKESMKESMETIKGVVFGCMDEALKSILGREFVGKSSSKENAEEQNEMIDITSEENSSILKRSLKFVKEFDFKKLIMPLIIILAILLVFWIVSGVIKYISNLQQRMEMMQELLLDVQKRNMEERKK